MNTVLISISPYKYPRPLRPASACIIPPHSTIEITITSIYPFQNRPDLMTQMRGIVSILKSDNHETTTKAAASLRRTLSADMSSKRWMAEKGLSFSPVMKKIASSDQIAVNSLSSYEEECEVKGNGDGDKMNHTRIDIWTAIMAEKAQDDLVNLPPPYVHPLVKKSGSSLSEKSLKICTESLGSETGSDVFSSSETGSDANIQQESENDVMKESDRKEYGNTVVRFACLTTKKAQVQPPRSFPPPLPSLTTARTDGPSLHMHSQRVDGRLVVAAVSVPQQKYFEAQRQDGRFLLTLINNPDVHINGEDGHVESHLDEESGILNTQPPNKPSTIAINIQKSTLPSIKRIAERDNENPFWSPKLNAKIASLPKLQVVEEEDTTPTPIFTQSLRPPPPRTTGLPPLPSPPPAATSWNSYQYFWRAKPTVASVIDPLITQHRPPTKIKDLVLLRGNKADCFLPSLKGCKEPRRSILMWEPFCIATS